jgi:RNA polymerase sigma-70 factor (ECF subfamily)
VTGPLRETFVLGFASLGQREGVSDLSHELGRPGIADPQLIALARESREEALEVMYTAYKARIYTFLLRICGDPETSDDLTHDVFTKAYQALATLTKEHKVLPWLYRIAHNAAIDHLRRRKRFAWLRVMPDRHGAVPEREQIQSVLATLPPEQATALLLHALEGYSYREIADIQGASLPAVRSRIARARMAFKAGYATKEADQPS